MMHLKRLLCLAPGGNDVLPKQAKKYSFLFVFYLSGRINTNHLESKAMTTQINIIHIGMESRWTNKK